MKIRIKFAKTGIMRFIGHLDMMRYFQKAFRRAHVDNRYSGGFSPHQIMSFASPLGVGLTSEGEYLDIEVYSTPSTEEIIPMLNEVMAEGVEVLDYRLLPDDVKAAMSVVAAADYRVRFRYGMKLPWETFRVHFEAFVRRESIPIVKKTKKGESELDLAPFLYDVRVEEDSVFMRISSGSVVNIRPEMVIQAFYEAEGLTCEDWALELLIHRIDLYYEENGEFHALIEQGEVIQERIDRPAPAEENPAVEKAAAETSSAFETASAEAAAEESQNA